MPTHNGEPTYENDGVAPATVVEPTYNGALAGEGVRKLPLSLWQKIAELNELVGDYIQKDGRNVSQKYNYVSEGKVLSKVKPALKEARLVGVPEFELVSNEDKPTQNGAVWKLATVRCRLSIYDIDTAEHVTVVALGQGTDNGDKAMAKAQTQAFKYAWWKLLCLDTGDDPEADPKTDEQQFVTGPQQPPAPPQYQPQPVAAPAAVPTADNNPWVPLAYFWDKSGYPAVDLQGYMVKRFKHQSADQVLPHEINLVCAELDTQLREKGYINA